MKNLTINYSPLNFQSNSQTVPRRGASDGGRLSCHRMAHYVLIRCFLQLSHSEALRWCNFFSIRDRPYLAEVRVMEGGSPVACPTIDAETLGTLSHIFHLRLSLMAQLLQCQGQTARFQRCDVESVKNALSRG